MKLLQKNFFQSLLSRNQTGPEISIKSGDFIFGYLHLLYCKCIKKNFKRWASYVYFPDWIKSKETAINNEIDMLMKMTINVFNTL